MRARLGTAGVAMIVALGGLAGIAATPAGAAGSHTVTVTPSTGLHDGQTVTVRGTGFVEDQPATDWTITQCSREVLSDLSFTSAFVHCDISSPYVVSAPADASGAVSASFTVRTTFPTVEGNTPTVTCGAAPGDCVILVGHATGSGQFVAGAAPISFGPPVPTLRECIQSFLADREHRPAVRIHRLLVCLFTALAHKPR